MKHWTNTNSMRLSRLLTVLFFAGLIAADLGGWWLVRFVTENVTKNHGLMGGYTLLACLYLCSVPGYLLLAALYRLLKNLETGRVFLAENVVLLRRASWCCFAASAICLGCMVSWPSLFLVALAAAFVGLIVRVVKNVFEQAIRMKDELDYTV